jgi:acetyltransferase-like isoleucine patch superfamily enzyme
MFYSLGKFIYFKFWLIRNLLNLILKRVDFSKDIELRGVLVIKNKGEILLGKKVRINSSKHTNPIGGGWKTNLQCLKNATIAIGKGSRLSNVSITAKKSVLIGENVFIGDGVAIFDTDFHPLDLENRLNGQKGDVHTKFDSVVIGDGVFIGTRSIILKGVKIGRRSIIGAGSIVTKSVPSDQVWAGNPARYIKKL